MSSVNKVFLLGNLTSDPDVRGLPSGQNVCNLRLAMSREFNSSSGQKVSDTVYVDIVVFGKMATTCKQFLYKGARVFVEGRLHLEQWQDKQGNKQQKLKVVSENIQFCDKAKFERTPPRPPVDDEYAPAKREHNQAKANGYQPPFDSNDYVEF